MAGGLALACLVGFPRVAAAAQYYYVSWTSADVAGGTATGTITLPDSSTVTVTFAAITASQSAGNLYGAQVNGQGTNYWTPAATWTSTEVENAPPDPDILQLSGGNNETYRVTLSAPIVDPIMAIVSLGSPSIACTYDFDSPFTIVSQGTDMWGGSSSALVQLPNNVLQGTEGSGTIQFLGTFSTFSWTVPVPETWHGFTFGIRTTLALDPDAGGPDAGDDGGSNDAGEPSDAQASDAAAPDAAVDAAPAEAGSAVDAGAPVEAGSALDASEVEDASNDDSSTPEDATTESDASGGGVVSGSGCSCRVGQSDHDTSGLAFAALGALGLVRLLRRKPEKTPSRRG